LSAVAESNRRSRLVADRPVDGLRTVTLRGDVDPADQYRRPRGQIRSGISARVERTIRVWPSRSRASRRRATTRLSILRGMLIGLLGVFILLSFQFRSYLEPLIVMAAIPLALIGVVAGHLMMGIH
jgi:hydrophobic/amphiphilic exporter-1 (mainly G- bacteria), HAE1 family